MNNLSWLIYAAEVVPNFGTLALVILIVWGAAIFMGAFVRHFDEEKKPEIGAKGLVFRFSLAAILVMFVGAIPSKQTIYLIAGSEAGEYVVTSPEGQALIDDIHAAIKSQIAGLRK